MGWIGKMNERTQQNLAAARRRADAEVPHMTTEELVQDLQRRTEGCPDPECSVCYENRLKWAELRRRLGLAVSEDHR